MYEYSTTQFYGSPPQSVLPPAGFRYRDCKLVEQGRTSSNTISFSNSHPYVQSTAESSTFVWIFIWERYVPEEHE